MYQTLKYNLSGLRLMLHSHPTAGVLANAFLTLARRMTQSPSQRSPELESVLDQFHGAVSKRQFTQDWFENAIPT
jgi:hypothetical protein